MNQTWSWEGVLMYMRTALCVASTPLALLRLSRPLLRHQRTVRLFELLENSLYRLWWRSRFHSKVHLYRPNSPWHPGAGILSRCTHSRKLLPAVSHELTITVSQLHMEFGLAFPPATCLDVAAKGSAISMLLHLLPICMAHTNTPPSVSASRLPAE